MSLLLSSESRKRLVVLGLDGVPLAVAKTLGVSLPNMGRIAQEATTVQAELPELSPVNWTSFFTGAGPEEHGIFGFSHINPKTYALRITNRNDISGPTIFDRLGEAGFVSRFINLPNTYPVQPMRGMGISGFVSQELRHAAYPPFLAGKLSEAGYVLEADTSRGRSDLNYLLDELRQTLTSRLNALEMLWNDLSWDCFVHVFTETDRLFHFFMDAVLHQDNPLHMACMTFLAEWDHALGVFLNKFDALSGPKRLLVMADHGFSELKTEVCLNTWLKKQGYLSLTAPPDDEWDPSKISDNSKAFALDPGRIYIHTQERFGRGRISPEERATLLTSLSRELSALTFKGEKVLEAVHLGSKLYPGADSDQLPDLLCQSCPGFDLKAKFDRKEIFGLHGRTGTHTMDGAIFSDTAGAHPEQMRHIGREILQYFGLQIDT
ncbi:alkaline phosphatase family protein [Pseudodesulfovibrio sediminis]|uniref:Phosphodiesterase n=1 Tax=Pseudodesulfovibrio sediminis TaxID=2810563 RepID=A0ABN6ELY3_9BACT|nr:alkaline phosphatase family protein [Pseudodesulfovibrio sediminis]BCS87023.1 phosphodiesterase [Pseudodesulfovibrio sediminis]